MSNPITKMAGSTEPAENPVAQPSNPAPPPSGPASAASRSNVEEGRRRRSLRSRLAKAWSDLHIVNRIAIIAVIVFVPITAALGWYVGRPLYKRWKQANALEMADRYEKQKDWNAAMKAYQLAIRARPANPAVWIKVGEFLDRVQAPDAAPVWRRAALMNPGNVTCQAAYIRALLRSKSLLQADRELAKVPDDFKKTAQYFRLAGTLAMGRQQAAKAREFLAEARRLDPADTETRFNLALVNVLTREPEATKEGVAELEAIAAAESPLQIQAARELTKIHLLSRQYRQAQKSADQLVALPAATFNDRLLQLTVLQTTKSPTLPAAYRFARLEAQQQPAQIPALVGWLLERRLVADAERWLDELPAGLAQDPAVVRSRAQIAISKQDWPTLKSLVESGGLGTIPKPVSENAFAARELYASDSTGNAAAASEKWRDAVRAAQGNAAALQLLDILARAWNWEDAREQALWATAQLMPRNPEVWRILVTRAAARKDYTALRDALGGLTAADPENISARNDWALLSLLQRRHDGERAFEFAREVYESDPANPFFTATYAYSLLERQQLPQALETMRKLPPSELEVPARALYYGIILARNGKFDDAKRYLAIASKALGTLIPEERDLYETSLAYAEGRLALPAAGAAPEKPKSLAAGDVKATLKDIRGAASATVPADAAKVAAELRKDAARALSPEEARALLESVGGKSDADAPKNLSVEQVRKLLNEAERPAPSPAATN